MRRTQPHRPSDHRVPVGRLATAAFGIAGLVASFAAGSTAGAATNLTTKSVVISTVKNAKLGTILVSGKTLYTLNASKVACATQCVKIWPEVTLPKGVTKATAGSGVSASKLGTVQRAGGVVQVTYEGKALYWFSGDTAAGQVHGDVTDTWGTWSAVVTAKSATSSSGSGSGSGSGSAGNSGTGGAAF
jgi:predicted lipoprotein with Yx(FWY)xxD motif